MRPEAILRSLTVGTAAVVVAVCMTAHLQAQVKAMPEFRYVVVHRPGPSWKAGVPAFEQLGLQAHVEYFRKLLDAGKLTLGGPFMDSASGGMMIPEPSVTEAEITKFAGEDPAVKSGLLVFEVRPWLPALRK